MRGVRNRKDQHVFARAGCMYSQPVRNHAFCSVARRGVAAVHAGESLERAPNDFPDDLLSVATSCLDLSASLNRGLGRGAPISARHGRARRSRGKNPFPTRARRRRRARGCSRRAEFSPGGFLPGGSLCTAVLSACTDR